MKRLLSVLAPTLVAAAFFVPTLASADTVGPLNFESSTYTVGNINGQDGWIKTGTYDANVIATTTVPSFGAQTLQISDAVTSGSFGDQTFAKPLTNAVGEASSTDGTFSPGTLQPHFEMQFDIASALQTLQPGMHLSVSPDRGDGSRMSYLRFEDQADGIHVFFDDVTDSAPCTPSECIHFNETGIATISRSSHTIKLTMDTLDGPSNDVVKVYIDGVLKITGTSWENYYRYDPEASAEQSPRIVKTVEFRESGTANPADAGEGFLIDNLSLLSGPGATPPPSNVSVHIFKYVDGATSTAATANNSAFPMLTTFTSSNLGSATDAAFTLSPTGWGSGDAAYEASFANSNPGANYATHEVTGGAVVGADCSTGQPYALAGYTTGATLAAAQSAAKTSTAPNFTNLQSDEYVIVWNKTCLPGPVFTNPLDGTSTTTAGFLSADWTTVTDSAGGITYEYQASAASTTNADGSFATTLYSQSGLTSPMISTAGTPNGVYFLQVQAKDADGNVSAWSPTVKVTVDNTVPISPQVHIFKYVDGAIATDVGTNSAVFPMNASWVSSTLGTVPSVGFTLSPTGWGATDVAYEASYVGGAAGDNYATNEVLGGAVVGASCDGTHTYSLAGYSTGDTLAAAQTGTKSLASPSFTNLQSDKYVIVWNTTCPTKGSLTVNKLTIGGNSTFSFTGTNGIGSFTITTSANAGSATFSNLTPGSYTVTEASKTGWTQTSSDCSAVTVSAGGNAVCTIVNTNNKLLGAILGTKYEDRDGDGTLKDGDHHRLGGVTIYIDTNNNGALDSGEPSTVTDSHGSYHFVGLVAGTYHVREVVPAGWTQTVPSTGSYTVVLAAGQVAKKKDFGDFKPGVISGMKFNDLNANHKKDAGEAGLGGWTIKLKGPHGFTASTVTAADGSYSFTGLAAGNYTLSEVMQATWRQTLHPNTVAVHSSTNVVNKNFGNTQKPQGRGDRDNDDWFRD